MEYKQIDPAYLYAVETLRREIVRMNALVEDLYDLIAGRNLPVEVRAGRTWPEIPNGEGIAEESPRYDG
jgi:hypothetical protein